MSDTILIKDLKQTTSVQEDDIFIVEDETATYKVKASDLASFIKKNCKDTFIQITEKGISNGVVPLNNETKIDSQYLSFGTAANTIFSGEKGLALENSLSSHTTDYNNPHKITAESIGLEKINNTTDAEKNVFSATKLTTGSKINETLYDGSTDITTTRWGETRNITLSGGVSASVNINGSSDVIIDTIVTDDSHNHTSDTLPSATSTVKGITLLADTVNSDSTSSAATANAVKTAYDKAISVETSLTKQLNTEIEKLLNTENILTNDLTIETNRALNAEQSITDKLEAEITRAKSAETLLTENLNFHTSDFSNPHKITKIQIGLENVDNTSDLEKPISTVQQNAIQSAYTNANIYTDTQISNLINNELKIFDNSKVNIYQGTEYTGQILVVGTDGNLGLMQNDTSASSSIPTEIILKDIETNLEYKLQIKHGNLNISYSDSKLEVTTLPTKLSYIEGEEFDPTGMIVSMIYQDGTIIEVNDYTYVVNDGTVTISYLEEDKIYTTVIQIEVTTLNDLMIDFSYVDNLDGTYTITGWNKTLNGTSSTEMQIPDSNLIIL